MKSILAYQGQALVVHDTFELYEAVCEFPNLRVAYHGLPDKFCDWYGAMSDIRGKIIGKIKGEE